MNRWKITYTNGKVILTYKKSKEDIDLKLLSDIGEIESITPYTDTSHEKYIAKIKQQSEFLGYDRYNYEVYKCKYAKGYMLIQLAKDKSDNTYYDYAQYKEFKNCDLINPVTKVMSNPKEVYEMISMKYPEYIIYSRRYYEEPNLSKPKELKGIKPIGKATYIPKHCEPQVFVKENDVYIKHTDYFSYTWQPPKGERIDMPLSYYMNKYFNTKRNEKFVYPDNWGSIILRNEAWILLKDILLIMQTENYTSIAQEILKLQKLDKYTPNFSVADDIEWIRFWENVCKCVKENYLDMDDK